MESSTKVLRCNACGRYFNHVNDLREHEDECRTAKAATEAGRRELEREDHEPHAQDDADAREFKHGTRRAS